MISTKQHAILDYLVGLGLIVAPWLLGFSESRPAMMATSGLGIFTILYSLITAYEYSIVSLLPFGVHLFIDAASGIFLAMSPWLFGFSDIVRWPHTIIGILEIIVVFLSRPARNRSAGRSNL
jgi:hypothetical protein